MTSVAELLDTNTRYCYYLDETEPDPSHPDRFRVSLVFAGEHGHYPTGGGEVQPWYWDKQTCRERNKRLGFSKEEEFKFIAKSMFP